MSILFIIQWPHCSIPYLIFPHANLCNKYCFQASSATQKTSQSEETVDHLRTQLTTLMNSLATLSAEKSRMEASFQADKKQLRSGKEEVLLKCLKSELLKLFLNTGCGHCSCLLHICLPQLALGYEWFQKNWQKAL